MIGNDCVNHSVSDRDCSHCIWHTSGQCANWNCEPVSRKEALEALEKVKAMESAQPDVPDINVGDTISRQAAIDEIDEWIKAFLENGHKESAADACLIQDGIIQLPPAQTDYKTDHGFMWLCPKCGLPVHSDFEKCVRCGYER